MFSDDDLSPPRQIKEEPNGDSDMSPPRRIKEEPGTVGIRIPDKSGIQQQNCVQFLNGCLSSLSTLFVGGTES